ncbi:MAG: iron-containing alcohol dehydrogenase [Erysipelotrichaceae bacterium]|nr:iron-containing alcohol dehydrogenase [Erysipelotrichaceae bacterium]
MNIFKRIFCRIYQKCFHIAIPLLPYRIPVILENEEEIVSVLKDKNINSVLIVTDKGIVSNGLVSALEEELTKNEIEYVLYDKTIPNPTIELVEEARLEYINNKCSAIIALGGGSPIDLAKACGARIVKPKKSVQKMKGLLHICKKLPPLFAIPTTAGTGSETTLASVITDEKTHFKYPINDFSLIPHYAVLDAKLTIGLPKGLTATTGMDALTHAVEAFIGMSTTRKTRKLAIEAVKLIVSNIKECYHNPNNLDARRNMLYASHYAGIAFTVSYVGYVHAIAHSLGGKYSIPHGLANAVILPIFLEEYGKRIYHKLAILSRASYIASSEDNYKNAALKFIDWIYKANEEMGIPRRLSGIKKEHIEEMSGHADREANPLYPVPRLMNQKELAKMYEKVME